jgi:capsular polysaccharide biosynthesis protein
VTSSTSFDDRHGEPDQLRDQLRRLLKYRLTITLGVVLGLLGGLLLIVLRAGSYTSTGEVLVRSTVDPFSTFGVSIDNQVSMGTEQQIALSATVADRAAKALHEPSRANALLEDLRVSNPPHTQILRFEYTAGTPQRAARVTNAFVDAYLADRRERTEATVTRMTSALQRQVTSLTEENSGKADTAGSAAVRDQITALRKRISDYESRDTTGGDVVRRGEPPKQPAGPGPAVLIALGLVGGLVLAVVLAWLRSALEPRVRSLDEVKGALGAPVLAIVPGAGTDSELLEVGRVASGRAEAYRALAFHLRHGGAPTAGTLMVVAPTQDHEAEAAAVNLAAAFAESGEDVLLVDATASAPGLPDRLALTADASPAAGAPQGCVVVDAGRAGRFTLLTADRGTADDEVPASLAVTRALSLADSQVSALVLTRPLAEHPDGLAVAQRVDGVLVVGALDHSRRDDLRRIRELVDCAGGHIVGAVLDEPEPRSLWQRAKASGLSRRLRRDSSGTPTTPADDLLKELPAPQPDDTLSVSR